jgi:Mg2+ and Co2+ transporter CorA
MVYVESLEQPVIASRAEESILRNLVEVPAEVMEAVAALELLKDILDDLQQVGPMLRKSIKDEARIDLDRIEKRIVEILQHIDEGDTGFRD